MLLNSRRELPFTASSPNPHLRLYEARIQQESLLSHILEDREAEQPGRVSSSECLLCAKHYPDLSWVSRQDAEALAKRVTVQRESL